MRSFPGLLLLVLLTIPAITAAPAESEVAISEAALIGNRIPTSSVPLSSYAVEECIVCELYANAPETDMIITMDETVYRIGMVLYYENASASPIRQPIDDAMIVVEIYNESFNDFRRIFTDETGQAEFDFSEYSEGRATFKILYCPFCCPLDGPNEWCGWQECIDMASMDMPPGYLPEDVPAAPGISIPSEINCGTYKPTLRAVDYSPPPEDPEAGIPTLCSIGMIIFAFLGGALYMSGKNPFAGFSIAKPRISGKHIRYQARGRGWSVNVGSVIRNIRRAQSEMEMVEKPATDSEGNIMEDAEGNVIMTEERRGPTTIKPHGRIMSLVNGLQGYAIRGSMGKMGEARGGDEEVEGKKVLDMARDSHDKGRAYVFGGLVPGGEEGERSHSRGQIRSGMGRLVGKMLSTTLLGMLDRSHFGYTLGLRTSRHLQEFLAENIHEANANAIVALERVLQRGDNPTWDMEYDGDNVTEEHVAGEGECVVIEREDGSRIIINAEDQREAKRALANGEVAGLDCILEIPGEGGSSVRYELDNGHLENVQRVSTFTDEQGEEHTMVVRYGVSSHREAGAPGVTGGTLELSSINIDGDDYAVRSNPAGGGINLHERDVSVAGEVTVAPEPSISITAEGSAARASDRMDLEWSPSMQMAAANAIGETGSTLDDQGMLDIDRNGNLSDTDLVDSLRSRANESVNINLTQYSEELGRHRVTYEGAYGDDAGIFSDDATVEILDASAAGPGGEPRERNLQNGTILNIRDGEIADVSVERPIHPEKGVPLGPTTEKLPVERDVDVDVGDVLEHARDTLPAMGEARNAIARLERVGGADAAQELMEDYHPDFMDSFNEASSSEISNIVATSRLPDESARAYKDRRESAERTERILENTSAGQVRRMDDEATNEAFMESDTPAARRHRTRAAATTLGMDDVYSSSEVTPERMARAIAGDGGKEAQLLEQQIEQRIEERTNELRASPDPATVGRAEERATEEVLTDFAVGADRFSYRENFEAQRDEYVDNLRNRPGEAREFLDERNRARREFASDHFTRRGESLFRREYGGNPLSQFGFDLMGMDDDMAEEALEQRGYHRRDINRAMRDFREMQESAREYSRGAELATDRFGAVSGAAHDSQQAYLGMVPPVSEMENVMPRNKGESLENYRSRVESERREIAGRIENQVERARTRETSFLAANNALVDGLEQAAEEHGGRVEGYESQRFQRERFQSLSNLRRSLDNYIYNGSTSIAAIDRDGRVVQDKQGNPVMRNPGIVGQYTAFISSTVVDSAERHYEERRVEPGGRTPEDQPPEYPREIYSDTTEALRDFNRTYDRSEEEPLNLKTAWRSTAREPRPVEDVVGKVHEGSAVDRLRENIERTDRFVTRAEERARQERDETIREGSQSLTGAPERRDREEEESE